MDSQGCFLFWAGSNGRTYSQCFRLFAPSLYAIRHDIRTRMKSKTQLIFSMQRRNRNWMEG